MRPLTDELCVVFVTHKTSQKLRGIPDHTSYVYGKTHSTSRAKAAVRNCDRHGVTVYLTQGPQIFQKKIYIIHLKILGATLATPTHIHQAQAIKI